MTSAPDPDLEIHGFVGCPFAWRVRLIAREKHLSAAWIPCDVPHPDPRAALHNPHGHSPLLYHAGFSLLESEVIAHYLDEAFPERPLMPVRAADRATLRLLSTRLQALDVHREHDPVAARERPRAALETLDAVLADSAFVHGESPGLFDLLWWPFLTNMAVRDLLNWHAHPAVAAYVARISQRPSYEDTRPPWAR